MIFDTHAHYTSHSFDDHRDALLSSFTDVCGVIECGTDYASSVAALQLADKYSFIFAAAGIHPESLIDKAASTHTIYGGDWRRELDDIDGLYAQKGCVAVGECGLDYHYDIPRDEQMAMFVAHLRLAATHALPVLVHDREAHGDMYEILAQFKPKGILHCFSGSAEDAKRLVEQGMYIGFGGALTFNNARRAVQAAEAVPLDKILLETDCPYMAPQPFRGKENNSSYIIYTAQKLAEIKGLDTKEVLKVTAQNARRLFALENKEA